VTSTLTPAVDPANERIQRRRSALICRLCGVTSDGSASVVTASSVLLPSSDRRTLTDGVAMLYVTLLRMLHRPHYDESTFHLACVYAFHQFTQRLSPKRDRLLYIQSNADSDVGDQYMLIPFLADFQYVVDLPLFPSSE